MFIVMVCSLGVVTDNTNKIIRSRKITQVHRIRHGHLQGLNLV